MIGTLIEEAWHVVLGGIAFIVWLMRLEARANASAKNLEGLESRLSAQRKEDMEARARDWGRMEKAVEGIQSDIKKLLERGH